MRKVTLLLSGGMDSTTLLYYLLSKDYKPFVVIFNYGQRHSKEVGVAEKLAKMNGLEYTVLKIDLRQIGGSALTDAIDVPSQKESKQIQTVVPFRNTILVSMAAGNALSHDIFYSEFGRRVYEVYFSPVADDYRSYRDCRVTFLKNLETTLTSGSVYEDQVVKVKAPFVTMTKKQVVELGLKLSVPYAQTWTCYKELERPCLVCDACVERQEAFLANNIKDPLLTDEEWEKFLNNRKKVVYRRKE